MNVHERSIFAGKVEFYRADLWKVIGKISEAKGPTSPSRLYESGRWADLALAYYGLGVLAATHTAPDGAERSATREELHAWLWRGEGAITLAPADEAIPASLPGHWA